MTPETITQEDTRSSAEIEADIRHTRGRMDSTLDELGNRFTARSLVNSALEWWDSAPTGNQGSAAVRKAAVTLGRQARLHPMPAVLIGAGVAWLISESMEDEDGPPRRRRFPANGDGTENWDEDANQAGRTVGEWVGNKVAGVKDAAADAVDSVRDKSNQLGNKLHEASDGVGEKAQVALDRGKSAVRKIKHELEDGYQSGAKKFTQACDEYPLAVGVAFAAMGAIAGLVIPRTRREDELMGEQSDHLVNETKEKANQLLESGKEVGARVLETVKDEAREQGLTGETVAGTLSSLAERGGQILNKAKEEAIHAAEDKGLKLPEKITSNEVS